MSVISQIFQAQYNGDGVTSVFPVTFYFMAPADLYVETDDGTNVLRLAFNSDYTVTGTPVDGVYSNGGAVVIANPAVTTPSSVTLTIWRRTPITQPIVYQQGDPFPAKTHEHALDRLTLIQQELGSGRTP